MRGNQGRDRPFTTALAKPFYESKQGNALTDDPWDAMRFKTAKEAVDYLEKESLLGILSPVEHGFEDEEI